MRNARVFISCGQRTEKEIKIGKAVQDYFSKSRKDYFSKSRKFETYFAERVHSSDGLTENIFKYLRESEYFVFIDFKREKINEKYTYTWKIPFIDHKKELRGSLFANQELAIATFLKLQGICFCEKGIKREGIMDYQIYNAFPFKDGTEIIKILEKETEKWDINSVNELKIIYNPESTTRSIPITNDPRKPPSDWYHLEIKNRNKSKHAISCFGYATRITDLNKNKEYDIPTNELMWSGIRDIRVNILGNTKRDLDAFYIIHGENKIHFHQRPLGTTNPKYCLPDLQKGKYLIEYTIISSNFEKVSQNYILEFGGSEKGIIFRKAD